jgi:hypothetical protein
VLGIFEIESHKLFAWVGLLISVSQIARLTGISHQCLDFSIFLMKNLRLKEVNFLAYGYSATRKQNWVQFKLSGETRYMKDM